LIAEDSEINMILSKELIKKELPNAVFQEALNGKKAVELVKTGNPDIIFMDIQMPEMDGFEATRQIRKSEKLQHIHIPIIALTAGAIKGEKEKCLEAGMDDFIPKPIDVKTLHHVLEKYLFRTGNFVGNTIDANETGERELIRFDKKMLMEKLDHQQEMYEKLIKLTLKQFPLYIDSLEQASNAGDNEELKNIIHSIKGAALNMCFCKLTELSLQLEECIHQRSSRTNTLVAMVVKEWKDIELLLK
jgi:CheY-like chemotaxis protein